MTQKERDKKAQYIRTLELISIISEEWGESVLSINNYNWKGAKEEDLHDAIVNLRQIVSPIMELTGLLEVMMKLNKNG